MNSTRLDLELKIISYEKICFIFIYSKRYEEMVKIFDIHKNFIIKTINAAFGEFKAKEKIYILIDDWGCSKAGIPFKLRDYGVLFLNTFSMKMKKERDTKTLLKILIHELCHLTVGGFYKRNTTPDYVHRRIEEIAEEIVNMLFS